MSLYHRPKYQDEMEGCLTALFVLIIGICIGYFVRPYISGPSAAQINAAQAQSEMEWIESLVDLARINQGLAPLPWKRSEPTNQPKSLPKQR